MLLFSHPKRQTEASHEGLIAHGGLQGKDASGNQHAPRLWRSFGPGLARSAATYLDVQDFYIYDRPAPPGFAAWLDYARDHACILEQYDQIERDLAPFRALPAQRGGRTITRGMLAAAAELEQTAVFSIRNGTVSSSADSAGYAVSAYLAVLAPLAPRLPDLDFVINVNDEPRVLPGGDLQEILQSPCIQASPELAHDAPLHGFFTAGWQVTGRPPHARGPPRMRRPAPGTSASAQALVGELLPVFSQTKVGGCFADIMVPSWTNYDVAADPPPAEPWERRAPALFFRGSSTGGFVSARTAFARMHRQRLVAAAANDSRMDIGIVEYVQCDPEACEAMEARYGRAARAPEEAAWAHKYVMILDGNTFSSRLRTLRSGSLVFRAGLFREWFDERLEPFLHYLPVRLSFNRHAWPTWCACDACSQRTVIKIIRPDTVVRGGLSLRNAGACGLSLRYVPGYAPRASALGRDTGLAAPALEPAVKTAMARAGEAGLCGPQRAADLGSGARRGGGRNGGARDHTRAAPHTRRGHQLLLVPPAAGVCRAAAALGCALCGQSPVV